MRAQNRFPAAVLVFVFTLGCFASFTAPAHAALSITVGTHTLAPNTPNQQVQLFVAGSDAIEALNFNAQIADGGPELGGVIDGPVITSADIVNGTIFNNRSTGQQNPGSFPQLAIRTTTTAGGTVAGPGLLATLVIDTTGFTSGTYALKLFDTLNGPTDFALTPVTITDGSIVVPEPSCTWLFAVPMLLSARRRRLAHRLHLR
jgi:hypothetical protein